MSDNNKSDFFIRPKKSAPVSVPLRGAVCYALITGRDLVVEEVVQKSPASICCRVPRLLRELPEFDVDLVEELLELEDRSLDGDFSSSGVTETCVTFGEVFELLFEALACKGGC